MWNPADIEYLEYENLICPVEMPTDYTDIGNGADLYRYNICDCPCETLVEVERPSVLTMAISYFAEALVVTIIGINIGLR
jgi:hypothetical protein